MNRLGIGLNTNNKSLNDSIQEVINETPTIPEIGVAGPGGGIIFYIEQNNTTLTCYEASPVVFQPLNAFLPNVETYEEFLDTVNTFYNDAYSVEFFQSNEEAGLTYTENNDLFSIADVTTEQAKNIIGFDSGNSKIDWEQGWYAEFAASEVLKNQSYSIIYKEYNENSQETAIVIKSVFAGLSDLIFSVPPNSPILDVIKENNIYAVVYRKFVVEVPNTIAFMPAYPASPNLLPSEILIQNLDEAISFSATYNGLTSQNLPILIDRYRTNQQVIDPDTPVDIEEGDGKRGYTKSVRSENIVPGDETRQITFSSENKTIIAKVIYLWGTKPPDPWYDYATDEMLYLEATILCHKTVRSVQNLLSALAFNESTNIVKVPETRPGGQRLTYTKNINGQTLYYGEITFKIDVGEITFTDVVDGVNVNRSVNEVVYNGTEGTYQLMLFEVRNLKITSNKRVGSAGRVKYLQSGIIAVPTYNTTGPLAGLSIDTIFFSPDSPYNRSLKDGVDKMDSSMIDYEFKAQKLYASAASPFLNLDIFQNWGPLTLLPERQGAITSDYKTINLSANSVTLNISINIGFVVIGSDSDVTIQHAIAITENDLTTLDISNSVLTLNSSNGYFGTLTSSQPVEIPSNGTLEVLFYVDSDSAEGKFLILTENSYYQGVALTQSLIIPNTTIRTRYNYL